MVPGVVAWEEDGKNAQSVDHSPLTALLIEATKEQQREIQEQQRTMREQQAVLRSQIAAIRSLKSELHRTRQNLENVKAQVAASQLTVVAAK